MITLILALITPIASEVAVSVGDGKQVLVDGIQRVPPRPKPDMLSLIALAGVPRIVSEIPLPASVIGPPSSVAITPDGSLALVTSSRRIDPSDPASLVPDDRLTVVDLRARPARVLATVRAGAGASGIAIDPSGTHALVANRSEGSISLFTIAGTIVSLRQTLTIGDVHSAPAQPIFYDQGTRALISRDGDHLLSTLHIEGNRMRLDAGGIRAGLRPYGLSHAAGTRFAVVANIGGGGHDIDTISLIDLAGPTPRVVDTAGVGLTPEGIAMAPDGRHIAVNVNAGSNGSPASADYRAYGEVQVWRINGSHLMRVAKATVGRWGQGIAWTANSRTLLVQSNVERRIDLFRFDGSHLRRSASLRTAAPPAALAVGGR
ncbi:YncE family protein [Sphingomonas crusticola]|uniref:YncE family protein n=1 Tax=Sphingomonas crusticola TaxID=1697973 RepID=UPI000E21C4D9|nr:YncE family protein [Sphingomonas crusticola]